MVVYIALLVPRNWKPSNPAAIITYRVDTNQDKLIREIIGLCKKWTTEHSYEYRILIGSISCEVAEAPDYTFIPLAE